MTARQLFALDVRALALFRIALGLCALLDLLTRAPDVDAFLTDGGIMPRPFWFALVDDTAWSFHAATGSALGIAFLFVVTALVACALVVGFRTRTAAVALLVLTISLQDRNPDVFYGFDLLFRTCLFWSCFLPLSARFSVDALRSEPRSEPRTRADGVSSAATIAFTIQIACVYWFAAVQKLENPSWRDLSAGFYALTTDSHATFLARILARSSDAANAVALIALVVELGAPLLLFMPSRRARIAVVAIFCAFHLGIATLFTLGLFPVMGCVAMIPFVRFRSARDVVVDTNPLASTCVGAALALVVAFNVETVTDRFLPSTLRTIGVALHLDQTWNMFVRPFPDGWFTAPARFDGDPRVVDVLFGARDVSWDKPASVSSTFPSMRWRKYVTNLVRPQLERHRTLFLRYLCRQTRARHIELWFVREVERVDGAAPSTSREKLAALDCP